MNLVIAGMVFKYAYHLTQGFHFRTVSYRIACIRKQECSLQLRLSTCVLYVWYKYCIIVHVCVLLKICENVYLLPTLSLTVFILAPCLWIPMACSKPVTCILSTLAIVCSAKLSFMYILHSYIAYVGTNKYFLIWVKYLPLWNYRYVFLKYAPKYICLCLIQFRTEGLIRSFEWIS